MARAVPHYWSRNWKWEGLQFTCDRRAADGSIPFTWNIPGLGIAGSGALRGVNANTIVNGSGI